MNHEQFSAAIKALHAPAERQMTLANAMAKKYGTHSRQYKEEFAKHARLLTALAPREWEIWCEYCIFLFTNGVKQKGKEAILQDIVNMASDMAEDKKAGWRKVYTAIKNLP